jgi:hypothetical protein
MCSYRWLKETVKRSKHLAALEGLEVKNLKILYSVFRNTLGTHTHSEKYSL